MAATPEVVLISTPDETTSQSLKTTLHQKWPVKTAGSTERTRACLDDSIAVFVLDEAFLDPLGDILATRGGDAASFQILWLGNANTPFAQRADGVLDPDRIDSRAQAVVERLQQRARYDRLLTRFYELARERGHNAATTDTVDSDLESELDSLKRQLDELAADLEDEDVFEIALR